jgi:nucleotide-binding universal stress UspA family protein
MIVNQHPCHPKPAFKRLLVGVDFSAACEGALGFAVDLARFYQSEIDLFHMLPVAPYPKYGRDAYEADRAQTLAKLEAFGRRYLADISCAYHFWGGALPYREIFKCADRCRPDAIILGSHTKETQGKWYAGSTVEKVSFQALCPLFVVTAWDTLPSDSQTASSGNRTTSVIER